MASTEPVETYEEMSAAQKAALLMIALGQKWARELMRLLKPSEVRQISYWVNQMDYVPQQASERVIKEFYERLVRKTSVSSMGGREYLMDVLSGMMSDARARELVDDLSQRKESEVFRVLRKVDPKPLASYLMNEQPQTIALLLSYLEPSRAAAVVGFLPEEMRVEVLHRMAKLDEADPEVVNVMEKVLNSRLSQLVSKDRSQKVGGSKQVAEILNNISQGKDKEIIEQMSELDFDTAAEIKDLMFVFADVILLDDKSIQTLLKDVDQGDLLLSLKGSSDSVREKVFANMSARQAETLTEELGFLGPVKASAVQEAQQKIVNVIRKLDEEGKILIQGKGGADDVIA